VSLETKEAMEAAIAAHLADEMNGAIMTGYWLVSCGAQMDRSETTAYHYCGPDVQPFHVSAGLNWQSTEFLKKDYWDSMIDRGD
jgi:hypothetical protein